VGLYCAKTVNYACGHHEMSSHGHNTPQESSEDILHSQQQGGNGVQEPSGSGTIGDQGSAQVSGGPDGHQPQPTPEVAALIDPELQQRYNRNYARLHSIRMEREIEQMEREINDESRQFHAAVGGVQYHPPQEPNVVQAASFRPSRPPSYTARDEKEWRSFTSWWKVMFRKNPEAWPERRRVDEAAMELRGRPLEEWAALEENKRPATWSQFEAWAHDLLSDPKNRRQSARLKIRGLTQKKGQTVRDINHMLELWERDLASPPDEETKAYNTFCALHPDLQKLINIETHGDITSRGQVTTIAQRNAERMTLKWEESTTEGSSSKKRKRTDGGTSDKNRDKDDAPPAKKGKTTTTGGKDQKGLTCYGCGKPGHIRANCPTPKASASDEKSKNSKAQP